MEVIQEIIIKIYYQLLKKKIDLFICGHSHILKVIFDKKYNLLHLNPGALGNFGIHQVKTLIKFDVEKNIKNLKIIEIPKIN